MPTIEQRQDAFLPTPYPQNHAANLHELEDGTLLCTWFAGTQEGMADIFVLLSRRDPRSDSGASRKSCPRMTRARNRTPSCSKPQTGRSG
ncbi:hypothetical protein P0D94_17495 [Pseudomonas sp. CBSPCGW29]|nr:hypothetical protein P0D94_17495 [Pseudomonas sp. CBSPCGW29]